MSSPPPHRMRYVLGAAAVGLTVAGAAGLVGGMAIALATQKTTPKELYDHVQSHLPFTLPDIPGAINHIGASVGINGTPASSSSSGQSKHSNNPETLELKRIDDSMDDETIDDRDIIPVDVFSAEHFNRIATVINTNASAAKFANVHDLYRILINLDYIDLNAVSAVCRGWKEFAAAMKTYPPYVHACAVQGFNDGVYGTLRGIVWQHLSGSATIIEAGGAALYAQLLQSAPRASNETMEDHTSAAETISKDVGRTIVHLDAFTNKKDALTALSNVLNAYAVADPEIGYTQGMNFVAAYLLTKMPEMQAYWLLHTILFDAKYDMRRFYQPDLRGLLIFKYQFDLLFKAFLPELYEHFTTYEVHSDVLTEWFMTIFTFRGFPRQTVDRVWDIFIVDGVKTIHRVALAILTLSQPILLHYEFEEMVYYLKNLPDSGILLPDELVRTAMTMKITNRMLKGLERQWVELKQAEVEEKLDEEDMGGEWEQVYTRKNRRES